MLQGDGGKFFKATAKNFKTWQLNNAVLCAGDISIGIKCAPGVVGPAEADIEFDIIRNDNDTFTVKYTPPGAGSYTIMVLFADQVGSGATSELNLFKSL